MIAYALSGETTLLIVFLGGFLGILWCMWKAVFEPWQKDIDKHKREQETERRAQHVITQELLETKNRKEKGRRP